jgi:rhodanese-related sulfurtransferase
MTDTAKANITRISPQALAPTLEKSVLVDVRSPIEFEAEHIEGAINIPLEAIDARAEEVPRKGRLVMVCRSGMRAERAAFTLMGKAFQPSVLDGGMVAWRKASLPIVEGKKRLPIERQIQLVVGTGVLTSVVLGTWVNPAFLLIAAFFGAGLTFAGLSGTCALGILLAKAPWNKLEVACAPKTEGKSGGCCS